MDYAPNTDEQLQDMLRTIGVRSFDELIASVPATIRSRTIPIAAGLSEPEVLELTEGLAEANRSLNDVASFLGAGAYAHWIPTAVDAIASRGEWLTPYTPYQAEASQGILQAIYEFQSMVCELMQMDVSNASLYDGASAVAEAVVLALKATGRTRVLLSEALHPHARQVVMTYLSGVDAVVQDVPTVNGITDVEALGKAVKDDVACVVLQQPNVFGCLEPMSQAGGLAHRMGALFIASVYPISLGVLQPPGAYGADLAVGEGRCFGSPVSFGGPGLGLLTATQSLVRRLPGRLAGCSVDKVGRRAYTLTLQTREQHIRREKATSNICTNEGWLALRATIYMALIGPQGLRELAQRNLDKAHYAAQRMAELGWMRPTFDQPFFNEWTMTSDASLDVDRVNATLAKRGIVGGFQLGTWYPQLPQATLWCATETISRASIDRLIETLKEVA